MCIKIRHDASGTAKNRTGNTRFIQCRDVGTNTGYAVKGVILQIYLHQQETIEMVWNLVLRQERNVNDC